jgi:hypothetical protein
MKSGADTRPENQKQISKTQHNTKSLANFKYKCAPVSCIYVSIAFNQQLARLCVTMNDSEMQSGTSVTGTENQKRISKTQHNAKPVKKFKDEGAHACRIHVSFGFDQQQARLCVTINGSEMQSSPLVTRTENQKRISKKHNTTQNQ